MKYPCTVANMNNELKQLEKTKEIDPSKKNIGYRASFTVVSSVAEQKDPEWITNQNTKLLVHCNRHNHDFDSCGRYLLSRSIGTNFNTCIHCDSESGYSKKKYYTYAKIIKMMSETPNYNFEVDTDKIPEFYAEAPIKTAERVPLVCKNILPDGSICGNTVTHILRNILSSLKIPNFICCQGRCDTKLKGKKRRKTYADISMEILAASDGAWEIVEDDYNKKSSIALFRHKMCGKKHWKRPHDLISIFRLDPDAVCPYCNPHYYSRHHFNNDLKLFLNWFDDLTNKNFIYHGDSIPDEVKTPIEIECYRCHSKFFNTIENITKNTWMGCDVCVGTAQKKQRAWVLTEACEVVKRRGFFLSGDPGAYTAEADIRSADGGSTSYKSVYDLVQAFPANANGFGKINRSTSLDPVNFGEYGDEEITKLRQMHHAGKSKIEISKVLRRNYGALGQKCRKMGLRFDTGENWRRLFDVDDDYFAVPNICNCYWAGLLFADGAFARETKLSLKIADECVLQQFMKVLCYNGNLRYKIGGNIEGRGLYAEFGFTSAKITEDLEKNFSVRTNRSKTAFPPSIKDHNFILSFLCGLIEGDGSIIDNKRGVAVNIVTASDAMAKWLIHVLHDVVGIMPKNYSASQGRSHIRYITILGTDAIVLLKKLADNQRGFMCKS